MDLFYFLLGILNLMLFYNLTASEIHFKNKYNVVKAQSNLIINDELILFQCMPSFLPQH